MIDTIRVIGAGAMGRGIAQTAICAGVAVELTDMSSDAVTSAVDFVTQMVRRSVEKGVRTAADADATLALLRTGMAPTDPSTAVDLVVEAVVERLDVKRGLFAELEKVLPAAILASNTSSIPIGAIAAGIERPERLIGLHFFNPVPMMKLVEIIPGLRTAPDVVAAGKEFTARLGHTPIVATDTPGFLVNHLGRALLTESLAVLSEQAAPAVDIDRIVRDVLGFKMGPFELMDLTGLDVSYPVMTNVSDGFFGDPRLRPSPVAAGRLTAGLLGRKSGEGFYRYSAGRQNVPAETSVVPDPAAIALHVPDNPVLAARLRDAGVRVSADARSETVSVVTPVGTPVHRAAIAAGVDPMRTIGVDPWSVGKDRLVLMVTPALDAAAGRRAASTLAAAARAVTVTADGPAPIAQRVLATIVNLASALAEHGIGTPGDIDLGARLGLGYPTGPLALGDSYTPRQIVSVLDGLRDYTGDPRYRVSSWLRARAELDLSLTDAGTTPSELHRIS